MVLMDKLLFFQNRTNRLIFVASVFVFFTLAFMNMDERWVAAPGTICALLFFWLWSTLWERDRQIPFFDVGIFCALATFIYAVYPLINYWVNGMQFGILSDFRLQSYNIHPAELGFFHLRHVVYLFCFVVFYSAYRGKGVVDSVAVVMPNQSTRFVILLGFLLLTGFFYVLQSTAGYSVNTSYEAAAFASNFEALARLPLILIQIAGKLHGILMVFKLALLFIVVGRCRKKRWFFVLILWILAEIIHAFVLKGPRTGLVLFLLGVVLLYHRMIKPFTMKFLIITGMTLFVVFIFMGLYRTHANLASLSDDLSVANAGIFSGNNEFQVLLGNAFDVLKRKSDGVFLPWYLYINDFIDVLPPQQIMPFEKVAARDWYLREIGLSGSGYGFMWGVISQGIIGLDWIELAFRGALLGYILALFHRWYLKHSSGFIPNLLYVFFCLKVYNSFRDTTFSVFTNFVWEFIPFYIFLFVRIAFPNLANLEKDFPSESVTTSSEVQGEQ
jgi:hypothetical protein